MPDTANCINDITNLAANTQGTTECHGTARDVYARLRSHDGFTGAESVASENFEQLVAAWDTNQQAVYYVDVCRAGNPLHTLVVQQVGTQFAVYQSFQSIYSLHDWINVAQGHRPANYPEVRYSPTAPNRDVEFQDWKRRLGDFHDAPSAAVYADLFGGKPAMVGMTLGNGSNVTIRWKRAAAPVAVQQTQTNTGGCKCLPCCAIL